MAERKGENQKLKMLYIVRLFSRETDDAHRLTMPEIISKLAAEGVNADRKTLYQDFEELRRFGFDIIAEKEGHGFYYYLGSRDFELPELKLLVDSVQSSKFITDKKSDQLIKKLESLTSKHKAQRLGRQVYVSSRIKTMNESIYYLVDYVHEAISENKKIAFKYFKWNEKKEKVASHDGKVYVVSPLALTWDDEKYYMIAYDSEAGIVKHFRVDKMMNIRVLDETRDGAEIFRDFDMGLYSKKTFSMYGGTEEMVTLRCKNELAGVMIDRFGLDTVFIVSDPEHFEAHVKVSVSPTFLSWLMTFGEDIVILSPDHVKDEYVGLAKRVVEQYS